MVDVETLTDEVVAERIHGDEVAELRRQQLKVPGTQEQPPIAVERSTLAGGPTRPPVLLVHGFAQNRFTWRVSQRSMAGRLAARGYDVWNVELRGHGNSRALGAGNARAFDEYVDDVVRVAACLDRKPFLIGHSLGGAVGVGVATKTELAGLVTVAGVYRFGTRNRVMRALARASLQAEPVLLKGNMSTGWFGQLVSKLYGVTDIAGFGAPLAGWSPGSCERELIEERLVKGFDWTSMQVWLQMARWASGEVLAYDARFRTCETPLLVLAGSADALLHAEDARACYDASGSTDRTFVVFEPFEHERHWGHLDLVLGTLAPAHVWPRIVDWLDARSA